MKLLLVILEGQIYLAGILAVFVAELALLGWGLWSRRPIVGLLAVFLAVPLMRSTVSAIRACFFTIRAPAGIPLGRAEGRALHDFAEEIRRAVDAPSVDSITITGDFSASAAKYSSPWPFRQRRGLVLGFPVLTTLSTGELRAVIAHELAHISSAHDAYAAWVYRTHRSWWALLASLNRRLATPLYVYWLVRWYVPRLNTASAEVARRHEQVADRVAATVSGTRAAADALVVFEAGARFADEAHWPAIQTSHETVAEPPRPYSQMLTWDARITSRDTLDALLAEADREHTHPSPGERLAGFAEPLRVPPMPLCSAGKEILGVELEGLADRLDREWIEQNGEAWTRRRAEYLQRRATLDRLAAIETPTADELFERGEVLEVLHGTGEALPIYERAAAGGHAAAGLAAGRVLLGHMDSKGIALVEAAMDRDDNLVPEGCRILAEYYRETNQELAARKCDWRATRHRTHARLSQDHMPGGRPSVL
jgi:Zn-dependent protease with chaperone function